MKVMVVEDEFIIRLDVAIQLEDEGFEVVAAGTADEALDVLLQDCPDVLFTDINMPGRLDGLQLARAVISDCPTVSIIITSGRKFDRSGLPQNVVFMPKPYLMGEVIDTIRGMARPS